MSATGKNVVRCVDCMHAGPMVNLVCRCMISRVGKTGRAKRVCDNFKPNKRDGEEKEAGNYPERGCSKNLAGDAGRRNEGGKRTGNLNRFGARNGAQAKTTGNAIQFPKD